MFKKLYKRFENRIVERAKKEIKEDIVNELQKAGIKSFRKETDRIYEEATK